MLPEVFTPELLKTLELLQIRSRRAYLGARQGGHLSLKRGHGIEFSDYRQYELGDNPRHIDWGVYARSDRLYVKRFQEEQDLTVLIIVDTSASMITPESDGKWTMARNLALALGYVALIQQDSVVVSAPGYYNSPHLHGPRAIHQLGQSMMGFRVSGATDFSRGVKLAVNSVRFPGVAIFISDLLMPFAEIESVFTLMRARNLDITAIQVLGAQDEVPLPDTGEAIAVDSETGEELQLNLSAEQRSEYQFLLAQHNNHLANFFAEGRISYTTVRAAENLGDFMIRGLAQTGLVV